MIASPWPSGLLTPLVTPFRNDALDLEALARLLERQVAAGVAGVVVGGGTGEFGTLSTDERRDLAAGVASLLDGRLPLFVQTGALATRDAVALGQHAEEVGAAGLLVASPFGEPISWRERRRFYETIADASALPIAVYNTPPAGVLTLDQIEVLTALPRVTAVKDSSADVTLLGDLLSRCADTDTAVYVGVDSLVTFAGANGARGVLVGTGNLVPRELMTAFELSRQGVPVPWWPQLRTLLRHMEDSSNYVGQCKAGLRLDGLGVGDVRAPYLMPQESERAEFTELLAALRQVSGMENGPAREVTR